jgi:hypothetical protein
MPLTDLRQAIKRLVVPASDLGLQESSVPPLIFPDDLPMVGAVQMVRQPELHRYHVGRRAYPVGFHRRNRSDRRSQDHAVRAVG